MKRSLLIWLVVGATAIALVAWIASKTYWTFEEVQGQRHGEALFNEDYAAQHFVELLGAHAQAAGPLDPLPPVDGVLVLNDWNWHLYAERGAAIRKWVEAGGRLLIDRTLDGGEDFEKWSGISGEELPDDPKGTRKQKAAEQDDCLGLDLATGETPSDPTATLWLLCDATRDFQWRALRPEQLALDHEQHHELLRVGVGQGSVTAVNAYGAFATASFLRGDHARLFVIATQLRRGDVLQFVRGGQAMSLTAWLWSLAAPLLLLLAAVLALALWRMLPRFGPPLPPAVAARRALRAQVAGTAAFLARNHGGHALWAASCAALAETASRHLATPPGADRARLAAGLASLGIGPADALNAALLNPVPDGADHLVRTLATLERARREIQARFNHDPSEGRPR